jgi:hypothetical protein
MIPTSALGIVELAAVAFLVGFFAAFGVWVFRRLVKAPP